MGTTQRRYNKLSCTVCVEILTGLVRDTWTARDMVVRRAESERRADRASHLIHRISDHTGEPPQSGHDRKLARLHATEV